MTVDDNDDDDYDHSSAIAIANIMTVMMTVSMSP